LIDMMWMIERTRILPGLRHNRMRKPFLHNGILR
jgi:hypothetical protein